MLLLLLLALNAAASPPLANENLRSKPDDAIASAVPSARHVAWLNAHAGRDAAPNTSRRRMAEWQPGSLSLQGELQVIAVGEENGGGEDVVLVVSPSVQFPLSLGGLKDVPQLVSGKSGGQRS